MVLSLIRRRLSPLFGALALSLAVLVACGGGGGATGGDVDLQVEAFDDYVEPTATLPPTGEELIAGLLEMVSGVSPQLAYLHEQDAYLKEIQRLNRDFIAVAKVCQEVTRESQEEVGLDWVIRVHQLLESWDALYGILTAGEFPSDLADSYRPLHEGRLRLVFVMSFGVDRVLEAAILMGPTGRDYNLLNFDERLRFNSLCREAGFFLTQVDADVGEYQQMAGLMLSEVNLQ